MNKTTKITLIAIAVIILWFVGYTVFAKQEPKREIVNERDSYAEIKKVHAYSEYDVLEAKKILAEKEKQEEEARIKVQNERAKIWSGFTN